MNDPAAERFDRLSAVSFFIIVVVAAAIGFGPSSYGLHEG